MTRTEVNRDEYFYVAWLWRGEWTPMVEMSDEARSVGSSVDMRVQAFDTAKEAVDRMWQLHYQFSVPRANFKVMHVKQVKKEVNAPLRQRKDSDEPGRVVSSQWRLDL